MIVEMGRYTSQPVERILVDGVEQNYVRVADTDAEYVERYVMGRDGRPVMDRGRARTERVWGRVKILFKDGSRY
jgi:hypothetical protein